MGQFAKFLLVSIFVAYIAMKWTAPNFDQGKLQKTHCSFRVKLCELQHIHVIPGFITTLNGVRHAGKICPAYKTTDT